MPGGQLDVLLHQLSNQLVLDVLRLGHDIAGSCGEGLEDLRVKLDLVIPRLPKLKHEVVQLGELALEEQVPVGHFVAIARQLGDVLLDNAETGVEFGHS